MASKRPSERSVLGAVAGDDEHRFHRSLAIESRQEIVKRLGIGEIAYCHVRHRLKAGGAHAHSGGDRFRSRPVRHRAEIDGCAALKHRERGDVGVRGPRRLNGKSGHQRRDTGHRIGGGLIWNWECGYHALTIPRSSSPLRRRKLYARRREIT